MEAELFFGLIAFALLLTALAFVIPPLLRGRARASEVKPEIHAEVFRREVDELQHDADLGELPPEELAAARERARERWLASRQAEAARVAPPRRARTAALAIGLALPLIAIVIYVVVGRPDAIAPEASEARQGDYVEQLQVHLARQPRDARGWVLLARALVERNDFSGAAEAYDKAVTASAKVAKDPAVLCEYADALGMAHGGSLEGKPEELITQALAIDPQHPVALEMAGSAAYAGGRYADAVRYWRALLAQLAPGSERHAELTAAIERAQRRAAVALPR